MEQNTKNILSEAVLLALGPVIAYLLVYAYELGYANSFNIPRELIAPNKTSFFIVAAALWAIFFPTIGIINIFILLFKDNTSVLYRTFSRIAPIYVCMFMFIFILGNKIELRVLLFVLSVAVILTVFQLGMPLITHRKVEGRYKQKLLAQENIEIEITKNIGYYLQKHIGRFGTHLIFYSFLAILFSYFSGYSEVLKKEEYTILSNSNTVILRIYGDKMITAKFDKGRKEVYEQFSIMDINHSNIVISNEKLGILKPTHK